MAYCNLLKNINGDLENKFPDQDFYEESYDSLMEEFSFLYSNMVSCAQVTAVLGEHTFQMGNTSYGFEIVESNKKGKEGIEQLKELSQCIRECINLSLPECDEKTKKILELALDSFNKYGFSLPMLGVIDEK